VDLRAAAIDNRTWLAEADAPCGVNASPVLLPLNCSTDP
jgi:hypothetical protein